jgi:hypothetical protein
LVRLAGASLWSAISGILVLWARVFGRRSLLGFFEFPFWASFPANLHLARQFDRTMQEKNVDEWRDKQEHAHTGANDGPVQIKSERL